MVVGARIADASCNLNILLNLNDDTTIICLSLVDIYIKCQSLSSLVVGTARISDGPYE